MQCLNNRVQLVFRIQREHNTFLRPIKSARERAVFASLLYRVCIGCQENVAVKTAAGWRISKTQ